MVDVAKRLDGSAVSGEELVALAVGGVMPPRVVLMAKLGLTDKVARAALTRGLKAGLLARQGRRHVLASAAMDEGPAAQPRSMPGDPGRMAVSDWIPLKVCGRADGSAVTAGELAAACLHGWPGYRELGWMLGISSQQATGAVWAAQKIRVVARKDGDVWLVRSVRESINRIYGLDVDYEPSRSAVVEKILKKEK